MINVGREDWRVVQWCFRWISRVFKKVQRVNEGNLKCVSRKFQGLFNEDKMVFWDTLRVVQENSKGKKKILGVFQGNITIVFDKKYENKPTKSFESVKWRVLRQTKIDEKLELIQWTWLLRETYVSDNVDTMQCCICMKLMTSISRQGTNNKNTEVFEASIKWRAESITRA